MNVKFSIKFIAASAAAVMALSLAGCSGGSMDDSSSSSAKAAGDTITIGTVTTNSGTAAAYGEAEVKGFELAVSEINAKGGINGKKVKLESMDDKGDATEASNAYNKLVGDNNVLAVAGPTISATTAAVAPLADQSKLVTIAPAATSDSIETGNYLFRTCFKDSYQGEVAARFAAENLKVKKVAVLYGTGDPYSSGVGEAFAKPPRSLVLKWWTRKAPPPPTTPSTPLSCRRSRLPVLSCFTLRTTTPWLVRTSSRKLVPWASMAT